MGRLDSHTLRASAPPGTNTTVQTLLLSMCPVRRVCNSRLACLELPHGERLPSGIAQLQHVLRAGAGLPLRGWLPPVPARALLTNAQHRAGPSCMFWAQVWVCPWIAGSIPSLRAYASGRLCPLRAVYRTL